MTVQAMSAARTLCELRNWGVSNLELQKLLYIAHMLHLGEFHRPLVSEAFEAWDYGPVVPSVYHQAKGFGNEPVRNVFHGSQSVVVNSTEMGAIKSALDSTKGFSPRRLVTITHWPEGAWAKVYKPNRYGIVIPNSLIEEEYVKRERVAERQGNPGRQ